MDMGSIDNDMLVRISGQLKESGDYTYSVRSVSVYVETRKNDEKAVKIG